jgi:hypothetical protein
MPFAADPSVVSALLRSGDRFLEPKAALKWAKRICRDLNPRPTSNDRSDAGSSRSTSINALLLISGVIALAGTSEASNSKKSVAVEVADAKAKTSAAGEGAPAAEAASVLLGAKARLVFSAFDFMERGVVTDAEVTILFISLFRAISSMAKLGSSSSSSSSALIDPTSAAATGETGGEDKQSFEASMGRNTKALLKALAANPAAKSSIASSPRVPPRSSSSPSSSLFLSSSSRGSLVAEDDFVQWAVAETSKSGLALPRKLPELLFKFNALDEDEYDQIKVCGRIVSHGNKYIAVILFNMCALVAAFLMS